MNYCRLFVLFVVLSLPVAGLAQTRPQPKPATPAPPAAGAPVVKQKPPSKDEVYFSIGRRINAQNNAAVSGVVQALGGLIEVKDIVVGADGKAVITVQELAPSNASHTQSSMRLMLAPAGDDKWTWEQFENSRRFYTTDKIFAYTSSELNRRKQNITAKWANFAAATSKQIEAAIKAMETAKAVLKSDPTPLAPFMNSRVALAAALKNNEADAVVSVYRDMAGNSEGVTTLADSYDVLKTNDAYLRLIDEFKAAANATTAMRRDYVESVNTYNEALQRLPVALVAYGLEFQPMEPKIEAP
jgi:hypothetical protein